MSDWDVLFPITDGEVLARLRSGYSDAGWVDLSVARKRPDAFPRRLVTVRNDSGPSEDVRSLRRYGVNVWADSSVDAENLAHVGMRILRGRFGSVVRTDQFSGPFEIDDEPQFTHDGKPLFHFYFTFRATVRGR